MYKLSGVTTGPIGTNCYTVINDDTKEAILIDATGRAETLLRASEAAEAKVVAILLTHAHFDHVDGVEGLREKLPDVTVIIGEKDAPLMENPSLNLSLAFMGIPVSVKADKTVTDGEILELIGLKIKCIEVPGHTAGGMCYYIESFPFGDSEKKVLFDGDTLFHYSIGRSDFPTGDEDTLINSIKEKLFTLPDSTNVFPGHEGETTIGWEKEYNPNF
ncbi:MAG: MBL fold metallo-hydrolase [Eubacterium sp.]|nr:MBL fold metallo-hydrolase [Eubacterium sp.]